MIYLEDIKGTGLKPKIIGYVKNHFYADFVDARGGYSCTGGLYFP